MNLSWQTSNPWIQTWWYQIQREPFSSLYIHLGVVTYCTDIFISFSYLTCFNTVMCKSLNLGKNISPHYQRGYLSSNPDINPVWIIYYVKINCLYKLMSLERKYFWQTKLKIKNLTITDANINFTSYCTTEKSII